MIDIESERAYGYEVEALETRDYYKLIVRALLEVLPFDYIVEKLRDECKASARNAAENITAEILRENASYQTLQARIEEMQALTQRFERDAQERLERFAEPHIEDWREIQADPTQREFEGYVHQANDWATPWRPFSSQARTDRLVDFVQREMADEIAEMKATEI